MCRYLWIPNFNNHRSGEVSTAPVDGAPRKHQANTAPCKPPETNSGNLHPVYCRVAPEPELPTLTGAIGVKDANLTLGNSAYRQLCL